MLSLSDLPVNCNYVVLVLSNYPLYFYYILSMPVCVLLCMCAWESEDNNLQLVLSLHHVGPRDCTGLVVSTFTP